MFFEVLNRTYHSPITIDSRIYDGDARYSLAFVGMSVTHEYLDSWLDRPALRDRFRATAACRRAIARGELSQDVDRGLAHHARTACFNAMRSRLISTVSSVPCFLNGSGRSGYWT